MLKSTGWISLWLAAAFVCVAPGSAQRIARSRAAAEPVRQAQLASYFPLAVGNSWTYGVEGIGAPQSETIRVVDSRDIRGVTYYQVEGLVPTAGLLRIDARGRLVEYREGRPEQLWYDFAAPTGSSWRIDRPDLCFASATIQERGIEHKVPAGVFRGVMEVDFGPEANCADAGLDRDLFAPAVGLIERSAITIAGPRTMRLREARINGRTVRAAGVSLSLGSDRPSYTPNFFPPVDEDGGIPILRGRLALENSSGAPFRMTFNSGQQFDAAIRNPEGKEVWRWSDGKAFTEAIETVTVEGVRVWIFEKALGDGGEAWPPGIYSLEAEITNAGARRFAAMISFEVTEPVF